MGKDRNLPLTGEVFYLHLLYGQDFAITGLRDLVGLGDN